jgi:glucokinase
MLNLAIGLDLGGTQLRAAVIDARGTILKRTAVATAATAGPDAVIAQLHQAVVSVSEGIANDHIKGVGLASPGPLDTVKGVALSVPTLAGFDNIPLAALLKRKLDLPLRIENDCIAAALGEWRFGAGQGFDNFVYVTVSTGIGGGVVADGKLLRGRRGMAGHIGHMTIVQNGLRCACGNLGCWEAYGSGTAFAQRARDRAQSAPTSLGAGGTTINGHAVFSTAAQGDALARQLVAEEAEILGVGMVSLLHLYSPDRIIMGGGMANNFDVLHPAIAAHISTYAMPAFRDVTITHAALGENSGLIGAAALVFESQ